MNEPSQECNGASQQEARNETVEEKVGAIGENRFPEHFLRVQRKEALKRHKDNDEEYQPYEDTEKGEEEVLSEGWRHFVISY